MTSVLVASTATLMCPYDARNSTKRAASCESATCVARGSPKRRNPLAFKRAPTVLIAIRTVEKSAVVEIPRKAMAFLPGAPAAEHTLPSTIYKTKKAMAPNMLPADFYHSSPEHSHPPLVIMLTLTQLSVGRLLSRSRWNASSGSGQGGH